jgi:membrane protein
MKPPPRRRKHRPLSVLMRRPWPIFKRACLAFYDDQMTQHAGALTYYALMSLFPAALLALSLLGLLGEYPRTYDAIIEYLRPLTPEATLTAVDETLRYALERKSEAATALVVSVVFALYGTTGCLEAARRALNVVFEIKAGRSFLRRKAIDVLSTFVLMALVLVTLVLVFVGGRFARDLITFAGLGEEVARLWSYLRWPAALAAAMLVFAWIYYVTPDVEHRSWRWVTPGAFVGVVAWVTVSALFARYVATFPELSAVYGAFAGAILLVAWLWLSGVSLLFGAELDAEIEREQELMEGLPPEETLAMPVVK